MKLENKKLIADEGLCLRRKGTTFIIGPSITLAKWDGKDDVPENFEEVVAFNVGYNSIGIYPKYCETKDDLIGALVNYKYSKEEEMTLLNNTISDGITDEFKEYQDWRNHCIQVADSYFTNTEITLGKTKANKLKEIDEYDSSSAVNSFSFGGKALWIDKATRVGLVNSVTIEKNAGKETTTLWFNGVEYVIPVDTALQILAAVELYALECYNVTASHKANIEKLETIEDINAYDFTVGYPEKLNL